MSLRILY